MPQLQKHLNNKTTDFFSNLNRIIFFCISINFWVEDTGIPKTVVKIYQSLFKLINIATFIFIGCEWGAFCTQHNLSEKQKSDRFLMSFAHTILYFFAVVMIHNKERVRQLLLTLAVELKQDFNDEEVEKQMLKRTKFYMFAFVVICSNALVFYGIDGIIQVAYSGSETYRTDFDEFWYGDSLSPGEGHKLLFIPEQCTVPEGIAITEFADGTFVTLIPFWPDVDDRRTVASAARVAIYVFWWIFMARITSTYLLVLSITICLSHQYKNLRRYFKSLDEIFKLNLSQRIKEERYEKALKLGVKLHVTTIWCTQEVEKTCGLVFSGQIIVNITVVVMLLSQMMNSERTIINTLPIAATMISMLFSTGVIMWNAGDVTVEASHLPTAMFLSGWQHCQHEASSRIRRLLLIAITQSQKPVVIKCLGVIDLSYQSYISIAKTSYSIFSVLY